MQIELETHKKFVKYCINDPIVYHIEALIGKGMSEVDALQIIIVALCDRNNALAKVITELQPLIPRRIESERDGKIYRYDAPDSIVPLQQ